MMFAMFVSISGQVDSSALASPLSPALQYAPHQNLAHAK